MPPVKPSITILSVSIKCWWIVTIATCLGCSVSSNAQVQKITDLQKKAYSLLFQNPDSAYFLAALSRDEAYTADNDTLVARADQILGVVEGMRGNYSTSLEHFLPALRSYEKYGLLKKQAAILSNVARVILAQQRYREAIGYLKQALALDTRLGDHFGVAADYQNLGIVHRQLGLADSALYFFQYADESARLVRKEEAGTLPANIKYNLCHVYAQLGRLDEARTQLNAARNLYGPGEEDQHGVVQGLWCESYLELKAGAYEKAIRIAEPGLEKSRSLKLDEISRSFAEVLAEACEAKKDPGQALRYYKLYKAYSDTVYNTQKARTVAELQYAFQGEKKDKEIQLLKRQEEQRKFSLIIVSVGALAAIFLAGLIALSKKVQTLRFRERESQLTAAREKAEREKIKADADKQIQEEKNKQLQVELESSARELATNTLFIHQKNKLLDELQNEIDKLSDQSDALQKQQFKTIRRNLQHHMNFENDWENIILHFQRVHPDFFDKLKSICPDLTINELKQAAYIRINLNNKEVANLMNVDSASVKMSRYRIKKKLKLTPEQSLTEFILAV